MSFGGDQGTGGELFLVSGVLVHRSNNPEEEFEVLIREEMPNRRHVLVMNRALLEDFVKKAQTALEDQG